MNRQLRDRLLLPFAIPIVTLACIALPVFAFSRILLAVGKDVAVAVALGAALDILIVCAFLASRPPSAATYRLAGALGVVLVVGGVVGAQALTREPPPEPLSGEAAPAEAVPGGVRLVAKNIVWDKKQITLRAGQEAKVEVDNQDPATPHNFAVYTDSSLATAIFKGDPFNGPAKKPHTFTAPAAGTYFFQCDIHPTTMTGTVAVQ